MATQTEIKTFLKTKLGSEEHWAVKALLKIYEFQTEEEKEVERTVDHNSIGFSGVDAEILSSFVRQFKQRGFLTPKQMAIVYKKMPKYWKQILEVSDKERLLPLVKGGVR